jgi:type II pantothenate kinase
MARRGELDFTTAKAKVGRPPKLDQSKQFKSRILSGKKYNKAVIFVDNSGVDFVFGMLPFARFLLQKGTSVVIAANTYPCVNDITVLLLTRRLRCVRC